MLNQSQGVQNRFDQESEEWFENYHGAPSNIFQFDLHVRKNLVLKTVKALMQKNGISRVAEIGCGSCNVLGDLPLISAAKVGVDFSKPMLELSKKNYRQIALVNGDGNSLPLRSDQFDLVLCLGVVQYIDSYKEAMAELSRILKPGGYLILTVPSKHSIFNLYRKLWHHSAFYTGTKSLVYKLLKVNKAVRREYKMHYFDVKQVDGILAENNLQKISNEYHTCGIMKNYRIRFFNKTNISLSRILEKTKKEFIRKLTGWTYLTVSQKKSV